MKKIFVFLSFEQILREGFNETYIFTKKKKIKPIPDGVNGYYLFSILKRNFLSFFFNNLCLQFSLKYKRSKYEGLKPLVK